jgi:hypothetical protein
LASFVFSILPVAESWYNDSKFVRRASEPLFLLTASQSPPEVDEQMLQLCNDRRVAPLFGASESLSILLYLWNLYGLWFKRSLAGNERPIHFATFLDPSLRTAVNHIVEKRFRAQLKPTELEYLISLCGFLRAANVLDCGTKEDKDRWLSKSKSFEELLVTNENRKSFLVAAFFLIGLRWLFDREVPEHEFSRLLAMPLPYEVTSDAFDHLRNLLSRNLQLGWSGAPMPDDIRWEL